MIFILNGETIQVEADLTMRLLDFLREERGLTGTKEGCGEGECGACAVLLDGCIVNACLVPMGNVLGKSVTTIEGLKHHPNFQLLQQSFEEAGAVQCGFCTPGMIMAAWALLMQNACPTEEEIRIALSGNLCRCTGYNMILEAVRQAAERGAGLW